MSFDIRQLDKLSYDEAEPILEDYIMDAIDQFVASKVGQRYVEKHPEGGGDWISTFIEFAFLYHERTLPKLTKGDVQQLMESTLPRKITLLDREDTRNAISELVAFWNFLKADYQLRSAGAIAQYLTSIEGKFTDWMFDPARGGIAKNFIAQGMAAGYDMTDQADLSAFQAEYNQGIRSGERPPLVPTQMPTQMRPELPPEMSAAIASMGEELDEDTAALMGEMLAAANEIGAMMGVEKDGPVSGLAILEQAFAEVEADLEKADKMLSAEQKALLEAQDITLTEPGTVVHDFQVMLEAIGPKGFTVSAKRQQIPFKQLEEINQRMANPNRIDLKRPQQKSYPHIHGLYLLLRATSIIEISPKGKQAQLTLNSRIYDSWQQLNPTEQYCTLFEAWIVRSRAEMLGEDRFMGDGNSCLNAWPTLAERKTMTYANYATQDNIRYFPTYHNLALLDLFGMAKITSGKLEKGKGWRVRKVEITPYGDALMRLAASDRLVTGYFWPSSEDPTLPFDELQEAFSPYFPDWQQTLAVPVAQFVPGRHIFKVTLGDIWRRLSISAEATLAHLSQLILDSVEFDGDHLDKFTYKNEIGVTVNVMHPYVDDAEQCTDEVQIGSLPLSVGSKMQYLFDFGASWRFEVLLEAIEPEPEKSKSKKKGSKKVYKHHRRQQPIGEILESHGEAPAQYDDDW